jgi:hypothetical protein
MIADGLGLNLATWQPVLERRHGRHVSGIAMPGDHIDWNFGRARSPASGLTQKPDRH